jgi:hypothetical protein
MKRGKKMRSNANCSATARLLTRLGLVATTATVTLMGPATAIAEARLASNHNEVMLVR